MADQDIPPLTKRVRAIRDPEELELWYETLTRAAAVALVRLMRYTTGAVEPPDQPEGADRMLKAKEASRLFGVSRSFLYEHGERLGFARRPAGIRGVRFSERALRQWWEQGQRQ